jgi:hypothetical protein
LLSVLCVFTLLVAQAPGGTAGYLCQCASEQTVSLSDHCHGPHSAAGQDAADVAVAAGLDQHNDGTCDAGEEREDHSPIQTNLQLVPSSGVSAPELSPVLVAVITEPALVDFLIAETALRSWFDQVLPVQSLGVVVGQTVVLLV